MAVNSFKLSLYHPVPAAQDHGVVGTGEIGHMDVGPNLNPWVILQGLVKNPVGNVMEEGRGEGTPLSNVRANLNGYGVTPTYPDLHLGRHVVRFGHPQEFNGHSICSHYPP